ncbi:hypothetical protein HOA55_00130 [archaeon]|jgi:hypothetical protein|nr:hypothetical protein [archaeon]MBT3577889.1 hypothetical protein [archaeon]MBT6819747.1 hypothetical protein [archaeon]MBT6955955.1 hypothetical protein [archaeon]MBT7025530.1 hypothetical protein [archaeon]
MPLRNLPSKIRAELDQFSIGGHVQAEAAIDNMKSYDPTQISGDPHSTYHVGKNKEASVRKYLCPFSKDTVIQTQHDGKIQTVSVPEEHRRTALLLQLIALNNLLSNNS